MLLLGPGLDLLTLQPPLQVFDLLLDPLATILGGEDVVGVFELVFPFPFHAIKARRLFLLILLKGLDQLSVGLSAGVLQRDLEGVEVFQPEQPEAFQPGARRKTNSRLSSAASKPRFTE
jgi:hypothetical protein